MKRLFLLFVVMLGALAGAYYYFLNDLEQLWAAYLYLQEKKEEPQEVAQVNEYPPAIHEEPLLQEQPNELIVPEFDLPSELPHEMTPAPHQPDKLDVILRGFDRAVISAKVTTSVLEVTHRMGERFNKGDLLILLDDTVYIGLKKKAEGNLNKAQAELISRKQLFEENIASEFEVKTAEANVAIAQSDLISAQYAIDASHIMAPYDGKVVSLFVEPFELIQEGKPLIEIVNDRYIIGQVLAPVSELTKIQYDAPVEVFVEELQETVHGKILRIDAVIDPASSTFKIDLLIDNAHGHLKPGMIGRVLFEFKDPYTSIKPEPNR